MVLLENGEVYGWGNNTDGQIGNELVEHKVYRPQLIKTLPSQAISISAGAYHSLALLETGELNGWGRNDDGQLGLEPRNIAFIQG